MWTTKCMARWIWNHTQENDTSTGSYMQCCLFTHKQVIKKQMLRDNKEGDQDEEGIDIEEE